MSSKSQVVDRFGSPISNGDFVLCKFGNYGGSSSLGVGKLIKVNKLRHAVTQCDDNGNPLVYRNSRTGDERPRPTRLVDQHNMARMELNTDAGTVKLIKKMTL